jgi:hypothetical protein
MIVLSFLLYVATSPCFDDVATFALLQQERPSLKHIRLLIHGKTLSSWTRGQQEGCLHRREQTGQGRVPGSKGRQNTKPATNHR